MYYMQIVFNHLSNVSTLVNKAELNRVKTNLFQMLGLISARQAQAGPQKWMTEWLRSMKKTKAGPFFP